MKGKIECRCCQKRVLGEMGGEELWGQWIKKFLWVKLKLQRNYDRDKKGSSCFTVQNIVVIKCMM